MKRLLLLSAPDGPLATALFGHQVDELVCVTSTNAHVRLKSGDILSGTDIPISDKSYIDIPALRVELLKAYPLIDRWVGKKQSFSTTFEHMLEYTITLIRLMESYKPQFAVLETGAPHHLFSYCLDVALRFAAVPAYYLYGNAYDGRCLVVRGVEKHEFLPVTDYSAETVVDEYIGEVLRNATYTPADSTKSLGPLAHKLPAYAFFLHLKDHLARIKAQLGHGARQVGSGKAIRLSLPVLGLLELLPILWGQVQYRKHIARAGSFAPADVGSDDIVYVGHMVPEATSFPESPDYPGEIDVLIDLKNRFPDAKIFYREHPAIALYAEFGHLHLQGLHKNAAFYSQLTRLGIRIIPASLHISKIRESGCLFATKTGRVAVENSILGLPTLLYGFPFYGYTVPLTVHVQHLLQQTSVSELKTRLKETIEPLVNLRRHLTDKFSGSIQNPGIGLGDNEDARAEFNNDVALLVKKLAK